MALVSQSIKNLKGGISQQPNILRFPDQGQAQINGFSSEVEGLQKRPPSKHIKRIANSGAFGVKPKIHMINRDSSERYEVVFDGNTFWVYDLAGNPQPVKADHGVGYIQCANPREDLKMVTVADYTFIVNRNVKVLEDTYPTHYGYPPSNKRAIINIRGGQYGKMFEVWINGGKYGAFQTPRGDDPSHIDQVDTQYIATKLTESLNANFTANGADFTAGLGQGFIFIAAGANGSIDSLTTQDGYNNQLMNGFIYEVQGISKLPVNCVDGYIVKMIGEAGSDQDDYYLRYDLATKTWKETVRQGISQGFLNTTMPHAIIRLEDGTFSLEPMAWAPRTCGDDESNPHPSFLGQTINDIFFFRNRLGFLSGENVILSRSADYFKLYPLSVAQLGDSDPIDVASSANRISILKHAVPFSEDLLLWSDQAQFVLGADGILTPESVRLDMTTEFEVSDYSRPYGIGRGVYYVAPRASFSSIRRYYAVQDVSAVRSAEDISAHVPSYVPNGVFSLNGSSTENFLTVLTEGAPSFLYMYKFLYLDEQLAQQSWSHWDFGANTRVLSAEMVNSVMYVILDSPSGITMESIEFTQNTVDYPQEPYRLFMDRKLVITIPAGAYDDDLYETRFHLSTIYGAVPETGRYYVVSTSGEVLLFDPPMGGWATDDAIRLTGNREGETFIIGESYEFRYEFSQFLIKRQEQNGVTTEDIGRLQLRRAWVNYEKSGNFTMLVNTGGATYRYDMTGKRLSSASMILGEENLDTGQFRFPIQADAKRTSVTCVSSTPSPVSLIGCGWEGNFNRRAGGI